MSAVTIHSLEFSDVVVKRFGSYDRGEHLREWRSLRLLDRHSPGPLRDRWPPTTPPIRPP